MFSISNNGMYTYDTSTGVYRALYPQDTVFLQKSSSRPARLTGLNNDLDFSQAQSVCGNYFDEEKLVYAKLGKVVLYLCNFEEQEVSWADVKQQMGRLNAECVHGQSGITGRY
jgi:hypothetical protein